MTVLVPNANLRTRPRWVFAFALLWGFGGLLPTMVALLAALVSTPALFLAPVAYFAGLIAFGRVLWPMRVQRTGALRADETGVYLDGKRVAKRSKLSYGHIVEVAGKTVLRLAPRGMNPTPVDIEVADEAQANELLAALRLNRTVAQYNMFAQHVKDARTRLATLFGGSLLVAFSSLIGGVLIRPGSSVGHHLLVGIIPLVVWALGMFGAMVSATSRELFVSVGEDGLWLRQPFVQKRFVSFRDVESIEQADRNLTLKLTDGSTIPLHRRGESADEANDLVARIRAGILTFEAAPKRAAEAVGRNGRTIAEWIANAAKAHERAANYRAPVVPQDELWRIVEDASASTTERAGAALALRADLDDDGKIRLRVAAGGCAERKLRVALESVTADDDTLAAALEPLEDEAPSRRAIRRA